jgi:ubiquinone biosynthesis accessory factor UbiK
MTVKPPPLDDVVSQLSALASNGSAVKAELDRNMKQLMQGALARLDVVTRSEFDAQTAVLARCREQLSALEVEMARLSQIVETLEQSTGR